jgi:hypothetical protein
MALQNIVDAFKGNNPKDIAKKIEQMAKTRREQAALDDALKTCSGRGLKDDNFWSCVAGEFQANLSRVPRVEAPNIPPPPSVEY